MSGAPVLLRVPQHEGAGGGASPSASPAATDQELGPSPAAAFPLRGSDLDFEKLKACGQGSESRFAGSCQLAGRSAPGPTQTRGNPSRLDAAHPGRPRLVLGRGTRGGGPRAGHPAPVAFAVLAPRRGTACRARGPARRVPLPGEGARSPSIARSPPPTGPGGRTAARPPSPIPATASGHCRRRLPGASAEPDSPRSKMAAPMLP